jgi:hypothetical protein
MIGAVACAGAVGCAADVPDDESVDAQEGELGRTPKSAGIAAGSLEEEGVLLLVNDRAVDAATLTARTRMTAGVAKAIVAFRTDDEGKPRWFSNIDEIDAIPRTGKATFVRLVDDARKHGYVEAPGFEPPAYRLSIPDHLGRPPTSADVTVEAGFDGKTPDEARAIVLSRLTNTVHESNRRFIDKTITDAHKAFTIAVSNLFAPRSPHAAWIGATGAEKITVLGTTSAVMPTFIKAEAGDSVAYFARGASGAYEAIQEPRYPVIMRARVSLEPAGVRIFYPAWSAKVLTGPTTVITEGGR